MGSYNLGTGGSHRYEEAFGRHSKNLRYNFETGMWVDSRNGDKFKNGERVGSGTGGASAPGQTFERDKHPEPICRGNLSGPIPAAFVEWCVCMREGNYSQCKQHLP